MQFESCLSLKQQQLPFGVSVLLLSAAGAKVRSQGKARSEGSAVLRERYMEKVHQLWGYWGMYTHHIDV